jgi:hypothetical protein
MLVLAEAAVFMFVVGLGGERQQGDSEEQGAHGGPPVCWINLLRYNR